MFRKFAITLSLVIFSIFLSVATYWHPLDVSNTTLTIYDSSIIWVTYIHPVELDRILVSSGWMEPTSITLESYYSLTGILTNYLNETLQVTNIDKLCTMWNFEFQEWLMIDEIYSGWFPISYTFYCSDKIQDPIVKITFLNEVPLQTNRLYIYQTLSWTLQRTAYKVLNAKKDSHTLNLSIDSNFFVIDSDKDWLSDEDESLYNTNPNNSDTDGDGYSDLVEIQSSWNPLTKELSPWQRTYSKEENNIIQQNTKNNESLVPIARNWTNLSQDSSVWGGERFRNILRDIRLYIEWSTEWKNLWILLFSIWILWFLHAIWPGHSKGILISQIIDDDMSYSKSIMYCLVFTCIHLIDIIIVVIITKLFFNFLDPSVYLSTISRLSAVLVFGIWLYLIFYSIKKYRQKNNQTPSRNVLKEKNYIVMAIITWLTPCAFGWSIFLMLMAIGKMSLAPPLLLSLWIGIFLCLSLIASITWFMKDRIYTFSPKISTISPIISSIFIICIGAGLIIQNF
jgi:ABC-type nickel/cobalt efflux system permease component RcnA